MNCTSTKINSEKNSMFFVGTYTNGESKGIYQYQIDKNGFLKNNGLKAITKNPSFLAKTNDGKTLIAVSELAEEKTGYVKSFAIENDTLIYKSSSKSGGENPCFVAVNDKNQVIVANYSGGNVGFLELNTEGKFVYTSNRGHNSIAIFKVNSQNGALELVGFEPVKGANPRNFSLIPDDKFLLVANQDSNNIVSFKRDVETGKLLFVNEISAPNPVRILF